MDVIFPAERVLLSIMERIGFSLPGDVADFAWKGLYRDAWLEEAQLLLAEGWELGGKETFVELHTLVRVLDEWDRISRKLNLYVSVYVWRRPCLILSLPVPGFIAFRRLANWQRRQQAKF